MASCAQINNLFQAWIDGELGHGERVILDQHLAECPSCRTAARKHQRVAALLFESFAPQRLKQDLAPMILENLPEMEPLRIHVRHELGRREIKPVRRLGLRHAMPAVAAWILVGVAVVLYLQWPLDPHQAQDAVGVVTWCVGEVKQGEGMLPLNAAHTSGLVRLNQKFRTGPGSNLMLSLRGPTILKVNEKTRFSVGGDREVHLEEGQVWFDVAKENRRFRLYTPAGDVTVLGTMFDVRVEQSRAVVTVIEGLVEVSNGVSTVHVKPGQQVEMAAGKPIEPMRVVVVDEVTRWADAIQPDTQAAVVFNQTLQTRAPEELQAEQVFVVMTNDAEGERAVSSFELAWDAEDADAPRCGYSVHVYNDRMEELFREHVDGETFANKETNSITIPVPGDPISGVNIIHIKLVPDFSTGNLKTSFSRISAMGI